MKTIVLFRFRDVKVFLISHGHKFETEKYVYVTFFCWEITVFMVLFSFVSGLSLKKDHISSVIITKYFFFYMVQNFKIFNFAPHYKKYKIK